MFQILLVAAALGPVAEFKAAFPAASVSESRAGGRLTGASGFEAPSPGETPEAAARAFLKKYGAAFGIDPRQELVVRTSLAAGQVGPVRFERRIDGLPLFDGDVVVGIDAKGAADWLMEYALMTRARAEQHVRFIAQYRSYVINYNLGKDIVRHYIEARGGTADRPGKRWEEFAKLLSSPAV